MGHQAEWGMEMAHSLVRLNSGELCFFWRNTETVFWINKVISQDVRPKKEKVKKKNYIKK